MTDMFALLIRLFFPSPSFPLSSFPLFFPSLPPLSAPVVGFDMGGTSTDVSRYAGRLEHVFETTTAGVTIQAPQLDVNTVAAGGGSRLFFTSGGLFAVGPESAGAFPGPVCYRRPGGLLAVTDANLILGRLVPEYFPHIFGEAENEPLDEARTAAAFDALTADINAANRTAGRPEMSRDQVASGFVEVANEAMCRPIRELTQARGHDTKTHVLACFGGAGAQHGAPLFFLAYRLSHRGEGKGAEGGRRERMWERRRAERRTGGIRRRRRRRPRRGRRDGREGGGEERGEEG